MRNDTASQDRKHSDTREAGDKKHRPTEDAVPPNGQGHQPLPGENPPPDDGGKHRKHVQNADLPPGQGHQTLPGEDPEPED
ncbi:MAG: hypothetical protein ACREP7_19465 [Lysobacter sp.]